jgi:hypothetical protein
VTLTCHSQPVEAETPTGNQTREKLRAWLAPPDPSINQNIASDLQHHGTATWFIQGDTFKDWKVNGSLLWVRGSRTHLLPSVPLSLLNHSSASQRVPGRVSFGTQLPPCSGHAKFIFSISSAIIEDIIRMQKAGSALVAYYYFDFKDLAKRDIRGLLSSLLTQLSNNSDRCWDILSELCTTCHDGSTQPSEAALTYCLRDMLELPGKDPIYIIIDALDECPNTTGTPSSREKVLKFLRDLVAGSKNSNLHTCVTSRPEQDIQDILNSLASGSRCVSLHREGGQREDIMNYIRSFVHNDPQMRRWRESDKELVINTLSERAQGMWGTSFRLPRSCHSRYRTGFDGCFANWTRCVGACRRVFARP